MRYGSRLARLSLERSRLIWEFSSAKENESSTLSKLTQVSERQGTSELDDHMGV